MGYSDVGMQSRVLSMRVIACLRALDMSSRRLQNEEETHHVALVEPRGMISPWRHMNRKESERAAEGDGAWTTDRSGGEPGR